VFTDPQVAGELEPACYLYCPHYFYWFIFASQCIYEYRHCVQKKHPLTFSFISPWIICGFKQKFQWIYPRNGRF